MIGAEVVRTNKLDNDEATTSNMRQDTGESNTQGLRLSTLSKTF